MNKYTTRLEGQVQSVFDEMLKQPETDKDIMKAILAAIANNPKGKLKADSLLKLVLLKATENLMDKKKEEAKPLPLTGLEVILVRTALNPQTR